MDKRSDYTREEAAFLPAALAIQESPVHPLPRAVSGLIVAGLCLFFVWSFVGKVEIVASAPGKVIPHGKAKNIQSSQIGVVSTIPVQEGSFVKEGDVMLTLDTTELDRDEAKTVLDAAVAEAEIARGLALIKALDDHHAPTLLPLDGAEGAVRSEVFANAQRLAAAVFQEYMEKMGRLASEEAQKRAELTHVRQSDTALAAEVQLINERAADYKRLVAQNFVSKHAYSQQAQSVLDQQVQHANQQAKIVELEAAIEETVHARSAATLELRRQSYDTVAEATPRMRALRDELAKIRHKRSQMRITAPVAGRVHDLQINTRGAYVAASQTICALVPSAEEIMVDAQIANKDIGFIHNGLRAMVKAETFDYTKYGMLEGEVVNISADASADPKGQLQYDVRIKLKKNSMLVDGRSAFLSPGMAATVEIVTGEQRIIDYLTSPIARLAGESLHER